MVTFRCVTLLIGFGSSLMVFWFSCFVLVVSWAFVGSGLVIVMVAIKHRRVMQRVSAVWFLIRLHQIRYEGGGYV